MGLSLHFIILSRDNRSLSAVCSFLIARFPLSGDVPCVWNRVYSALFMLLLDWLR
jgi:hypothetical protein